MGTTVECRTNCWNGLVADAYLAALALRLGRQLVTFDGGFRQFEGLEVTAPEQRT
jgi:predicted nucleic acid-binding protein